MVKNNIVTRLGNTIRGKNTGPLKNFLTGPNTLAPQKSLGGQGYKWQKGSGLAKRKKTKVKAKKKAKK